MPNKFVVNVFLLLICGSDLGNARNNTYEPNAVVHELHRLPHLNNHLKRVNNRFDLTVANRPWNDYTHSLIPFPAMMGSLGTLAVLIFMVIIICRSCGCFMGSLHYELNSYGDDIFMLQHDSEGAAELKKILARRGLIIHVFMVCLLVVIISNQGIFLGAHRFDEAVNNFDHSLRIIKRTFEDLTMQGDGLESAGLVVGENLAAALPTCPPAANTLPILQEYEESVDAYLYLVSPIPDRCNDFNSYIYTNTINIKNQVAWLVYGAVVTLVIMFSLGLKIGSSGALALSTCVGSVFQLIFIFIVCGELCLMMLVADFCMTPSSNALGLVEDRNYDMVAYYSTCEGANPIIRPIAAAALSLEVMNVSINALTADGAECADNPYLLDCSTSISYAYSNLTAVEESAQCEPMSRCWDELFNNAVCHDGYSGMYITWASQCITCAVMFAALVAAGAIYPYFTSKWKTAQMILTGGADLQIPFHFKSHAPDRYLRNSSRTAALDDSNITARVAADEGFLFIDNDGQSNTLSFGFDDDPSQSLLPSDSESDDVSEVGQRLRFHSSQKGPPAVTHVRSAQGESFSKYLI